MNILEKISEFFGKFMAIIVLVIAALALFVPGAIFSVLHKNNLQLS